MKLCDCLFVASIALILLCYSIMTGTIFTLLPFALYYWIFLAFIRFPRYNEYGMNIETVRDHRGLHSFQAWTEGRH